MNDDTALAEAELSHRRPGPPTHWLLAVAAAALAVVGVGALVAGAQGGRDDVEMSHGPRGTSTDDTYGTTDVPNTSEPTTTIPPTTAGPETMAGTAAVELTPVTGPACPPAGDGTVCVGVDRGDVDGDGRVDDVAIATVPPHEFDLLPVTVRVRYATGDVEEATVDGVPYMVQLMGVTDLDGDGSEEIAFFSDGGAHGRDGLFMGTTRTGHLHRVGFSEAQVLVDGAALFSGGFACPDLDGDGRNELVVSGSYADPDTRVAEVSHERYRWDGDVLVSEGTTTEQVSYDDGDGVEDFREIGGANCGDLDGHL
jgi:hypothetical protein